MNGYVNYVRDYNKAQGTVNPTDLSYQIIRDINLRYITVQNSSLNPAGISITPYISGPTPKILFTLHVVKPVLGGFFLHSDRR